VYTVDEARTRTVFARIDAIMARNQRSSHDADGGAAFPASDSSAIAAQRDGAKSCGAQARVSRRDC